jgi:hypothetical protein
MKTCVLFNIINHRQENKTETLKPSSQILPVCLHLKADVLAVSIEKYRVLMFIRSYSVSSTYVKRSDIIRPLNLGDKFAVL